MSMDEGKLREPAISRPALKKRMTLGISSNLKEVIKKGTLENQEGKNGKSKKSMGKHNRLSLL